MKDIEISKDDNGMLKVCFPYNPSYIAKIETIPGYKWYPEEKYCLPAKASA